MDRESGAHLVGPRASAQARPLEQLQYLLGNLDGPGLHRLPSTLLCIQPPTLCRGARPRRPDPCGLDGSAYPIEEPPATEPTIYSLNDLSHLEHDLVREGEAEGLGRLQVDHELESHGLLYGEISRVSALEDLVYVDGNAPVYVALIRPI